MVQSLYPVEWLLLAVLLFHVARTSLDRREMIRRERYEKAFEGQGYAFVHVSDAYDFAVGVDPSRGVVCHVDKEFVPTVFPCKDVFVVSIVENNCVFTNTVESCTLKGIAEGGFGCAPCKTRNDRVKRLQVKIVTRIPEQPVICLPFFLQEGEGVRRSSAVYRRCREQISRVHAALQAAAEGAREGGGSAG